MSALPADQESNTLDELIRITRDSLRAGGIDEAKSATLAESVVLAMRDEYGGSQFYFPVGRFWRMSERDIKIYNMCTGTNWHQVAREFDITEIRVRQIHAEVRAAERAKRQQKLFPD
jgi:Mor family transcriptional regulator